MTDSEYDKRHGGPWDRGGADSYYLRPRNPHYYKGDTYSSVEVTEENMTASEIEAYNAGFDYNEKCGSFKDYG